MFYCHILFSIMTWYVVLVSRCFVLWPFALNGLQTFSIYWFRSDSRRRQKWLRPDERTNQIYNRSVHACNMAGVSIDIGRDDRLRIDIRTQMIELPYATLIVFSLVTVWEIDMGSIYLYDSHNINNVYCRYNDAQSIKQAPSINNHFN